MFQVGRHHFRQFLINVHAEENLRFWEAVQEFKGQKNRSPAMWNMGRTIQQQYLREGAHTEVSRRAFSQQGEVHHSWFRSTRRKMHTEMWKVQSPNEN